MIYEFSPKQDLHGYDSPWPAGGGKNIILKIIEGANINPDGAVITDTDFNLCVAQVTNGETYTFSADASAVVNPNVAGYFSSEPDIGSTTTDGQRITGLTSTFTATQTAYIALRISKTSSSYQLEKGSAITSYVPYENICPISGYNIWDPITEEMIQVYSGYVDAEARKLYLHPVYREYDGEELVGPWMSSMDKYSEDGTPTEGAFVVDFGGEVTEHDITDFMLQTLLDSLGVRRFITSGAMLLNSLMDQAQGRVRSEEELLNRSLQLHVIAIGKELPTNLVIKKPISDVLPGLPGKIKI